VNSNLYLKLFACCHIVEGSTNFVIVDPQRSDLFRLETKYLKYLVQLGQIPFHDLKEKFRKNRIFQELVDFLLENELAFWTETPLDFPEINTELDEPFKIKDAIIDLDRNSNFSVG
jgi:hypothetical protein